MTTAPSLKCPACGRLLRPCVVNGKAVPGQLECPGMSCGMRWWKGKRGRLGAPVYGRPEKD